MANASGSYETTSEAVWKAFDKLPREVREALSESVDDWVPQPVLTTYRRWLKLRGWPSEAVEPTLSMISRWNDEARGEHRYRMNRMAETGLDYHAQVRNRKQKRG